MSLHLPPNIPLEKVAGIFSDALSNLTEPVVDQIHQFVDRPIEGGVTEAEFQIFPDEYCERASSIWMYFSGPDKPKKKRIKSPIRALAKRAAISAVKTPTKNIRSLAS